MKSGITVTGSGQASASPDRALINLGMSSVRPDASAALDEVGQKIAVLITTLIGMGVRRESLQTTDLSLWAETDRDGAPAGYRARNTLRIELDEVSRVGEILRAGLNAIGDGGEMNGIEFLLKDPSAVAARAREEAYQAAVAKATQLATLAGRALGPVTSVIEMQGRSGEPKIMARMAMADSMPVEAGSTEVVVHLTVRFVLIG